MRYSKQIPALKAALHLWPDVALVQESGDLVLAWMRFGDSASFLAGPKGFEVNTSVPGITKEIAKKAGMRHVLDLSFVLPYANAEQWAREASQIHDYMTERSAFKNKSKCNK